MKFKGLLLSCALLAGLAGCASTPMTAVSRNIAANDPLLTAASTGQQVAVARDYNVVDVKVSVPHELVVSEANTYKPRADIVWREDPLGDRYAQVQAIVDNALTQGAATVHGARDVVLDVTVLQFHALTQKTRYTFGGTHAIAFQMAVLDAASGAVIEPPHIVQIEFEAYGGDQALAAEAQGLTQKVRITQHLAALIAQELTGTAVVPAS